MKANFIRSNRWLILVLALMPGLLFADFGDSGPQGELATLALWVLLAGAGLLRQRIRSDSDKHLVFNSSTADVEGIPPVFPETEFQPSRKQLKDHLGWWGSSVGGGGISGSAADAVDIGWFDGGATDVFTDGGFAGGLTGMAAFFTVFAFSRYFPKNCPYCKQRHNTTTKICPNTDLPLWLSVQRIDTSKANAVANPNGVGELIALHYYPYTYSTAIKVAPLVWELILLPDEIPPILHSLVVKKLIQDRNIKAFINAAEFALADKNDTEKRLKRLMISKGMPISEIDENIEIVRNNNTAIDEYIAQELRLDTKSLRSAVDLLKNIDDKRIREYKDMIEKFSALTSG